jgi:uncharacterized membrane protein
MKWYTVVLNRIFKGVILFLLPVMLLVFILEKAIVIVQKLILPLKQHLPAENIMGIGVLSLISILLLMLLCYFAGILAERTKVKKFISFLENNLLTMIPGYVMMKSRASEAIGSSDDEWKAVLVGEDDEWKIGIAVDEQPGGYCMVFFPEPPDAKSGEMKLVHESKLKKLNMPVSKLLSIIKTYGHGAAALVKD